MASAGEYDLKKVSADLFQIIREGTKRGLRNTVSWAAELYRALADHISSESEKDTLEAMDNQDYVDYYLAKSLFDRQEYDRAAYFVRNNKTRVGKFLHYYSVYCSGEKKRLDDAPEPLSPNDRSKNSVLKSLRLQLQKDYLRESLDGYCLYLYGVVLKKLQLEKYALKILCEAVRKEPLFWGSWLELTTLISNREMLNDISLPDCWIKDFFLAHTYLEFRMNKSAFDIYSRFNDAGFSKSTYVMAQIAIAQHNMRHLNEAIASFQDILKVDPYRLDNLDIYSTLLYVQKNHAELSNLAHNTTNIDRYRAETCCVIGNLYSLRTQGKKAVLYFQRALKLNPSYLSAWTLMGHEYLEMNNTSSAIQSYHHAIEVNKREYKAWYGLGKAYKMLEMFDYCIYYYKQAHHYHPRDFRIIVAIGLACEKNYEFIEAKKWFWRAYKFGDVRGMVHRKLKEIYARLNAEILFEIDLKNCLRDESYKLQTEFEKYTSA